MHLNEIRDNPGSHHRSKRVGRGLGSGKGKTCGSGGKGQTARSGVSLHGFEGGQTPLFRRLPKRGFRVASCPWDEVTLAKLQRAFDKGFFSVGQVLSDDDFCQHRLVHRGKKVRILASGELKQPVILKVSHVSRGAEEKVKAAGGKILAIATEGAL